ncbi:PREDICTED: PQ-loop repeat-containing protein 3 [Ceratosolen solmsi marchali]|uniref:Solute carrier family 66 member 3 n=1 Tax=Ceratosolen solmsi marchali TaxID=326594 RepID=A0AAJ6VLR1_9HYME|nr:PREDICTED: PQ-loop repeat-containing protein 3 [Ceratosolen solmsi marchali]
MSLNTLVRYLADGLSIATIGMCFVLKFPQIFKLLKNRSTTGISFKSLVLELISYSITTCYNYTNDYSLLSYLEYPIILLQEYILIYLVLNYMNLMNLQLLVASSAYFAIFIGLLTECLPKTILTFVMPMCTPISASSKVIQLMTIIRAKKADSVSPTTWAISTLSNLTRIFTIWMDSADMLLLGNFIISTALSASIMLAALYYKTDIVKRE